MERDWSNLKREELTIEKLKTFKGFENIEDEEAENIILTVKTFAKLTFRYYNQLKNNL